MSRLVVSDQDTLDADLVMSHRARSRLVPAPFTRRLSKRVAVSKRRQIATDYVWSIKSSEGATAEAPNVVGPVGVDGAGRERTLDVCRMVAKLDHDVADARGSEAQPSPQEWVAWPGTIEGRVTRVSVVVWYLTATVKSITRWRHALGARAATNKVCW